MLGDHFHNPARGSSPVRTLRFASRRPQPLPPPQGPAPDPDRSGGEGLGGYTSDRTLRFGANGPQPALPAVRAIRRLDDHEPAHPHKTPQRMHTSHIGPLIT